MTRVDPRWLAGAGLFLLACGGGVRAAPSANAATIVVDAHTELTLDWSVTVVIRAQGASEPARARDLTREVSRAYARYVRAKLLFENARAREERLAALTPRVRARVASGEAPVAEGESAERAGATAHLATVAAEDDVRVASRALAVLLGQPSDAALPPPADAGPAAIAQTDLAALQAAADRPGEPASEVAREIEEAHGRLLALVGEWRRTTPPPDGLERERARYEAGLAPLSELLDAVEGAADSVAARIELAARVADASAELEHAVGVRLPREPLASP